MAPNTIITTLGPYLSENRPPMIEKTPVRRRYSENRLEVVALFHVNSSCKEEKNTLNEKLIP